jgi:branched-chain amino acid transport system ATP-binding protein
MVVVDEPTEGLAPALVQQVAHCLDLLRRQGVAVLLMEQKMAIALALADRVLVMGHGSIVFGGTPQQLRERGDVVREWLQV